MRKTLVIIPYPSFLKDDVDKVKRLYKARAGADCDVLMIDSKGKGWVQVQNETVQANFEGYTHFVYTCMDYFPGRDYLALALMAMTEFKAGLVGFNDGKWHGKNATAGLVSKEFILNNYPSKTMFHTGYKFHGADPDLTECAMRKNKYVYCPAAVMIEVDYEKDFRSNKMDIDQKLYYAREHRGFDL